MTQHLTINKITPADDNVRTTTITEASVEGLAKSIVAFGVLSPLLVTTDGTIVAGHRRYEAIALAQANGDLPKDFAIPVHYTDLGGDVEVQMQRLIENLQRSDLTPIEEAHGYFRLTEYGKTRDELAISLGVPKAQLAKRLSLLSLTPALQDRVAAGTLPMDRALLLARLPEEDQTRLAEHSAHNIETHIARTKAEAKRTKVTHEIEALGLEVLSVANRFVHVHRDGVTYLPGEAVPFDQWKGSFPRKVKAVGVFLGYDNAISLVPYEARKESTGVEGGREVVQTKEDAEAQAKWEARIAAREAKREADLRLLHEAATTWGTAELNGLLLAQAVRDFWPTEGATLDAIANALGVEFPDDVDNRTEYLTTLVELATPTAQRRAVLMWMVLSATNRLGYGIEREIRAKAGIVDDVHESDD